MTKKNPQRRVLNLRVERSGPYPLPAATYIRSASALLPCVRVCPPFDNFSPLCSCTFALSSPRPGTASFAFCVVFTARTSFSLGARYHVLLIHSRQFVVQLSENLISATLYIVSKCFSFETDC